MHNILSCLHLEYTYLEHEKVRLLVRKHWQESLEASLLNTSKTAFLLSASGRDTVYVFDFEDGKAVIREYCRGGAIRWLTTRTFILVNRPLRELTILEYLFLHGFPCPEPLGIRWQRVGPLFRGAILTRLVEGENLLDILKKGIQPEEHVFHEIGVLIRRMHDLGVFHADLHLGNIILGNQGIYLIDFDKAKQFRLLSQRKRAQNLLRLYRSFRKHRVPFNLFRPVVVGYDWRSAFPTLRNTYARFVHDQKSSSDANVH